MEVALLDAAVLDRQLAVEDGREPEGDGALHLRLDAEGIDRGAAIDGAGHLVHADALVVIDRDLGGLRDDAAERFVHGEAERAALRRLAPAGLLRHRLQRAEVARLVREQSGAEVERVPARRPRQLVQHALHGEGGMRVPDRPPPEDRHRFFG